MQNTGPPRLKAITTSQWTYYLTVWWTCANGESRAKDGEIKKFYTDREFDTTSNRDNDVGRTAVIKWTLTNRVFIYSFIMYVSATITSLPSAERGHFHVKVKSEKRTGRMCRVACRRVDARETTRKTPRWREAGVGRTDPGRQPLTGGRAVELERVAEDGQRRRSGERAERRDELEAPAGGHRDQRDGHAYQDQRADGHHVGGCARTVRNGVSCENERRRGASVGVTRELSIFGAREPGVVVHGVSRGRKASGAPRKCGCRSGGGGGGGGATK